MYKHCTIMESPHLEDGHSRENIMDLLNVEEKIMESPLLFAFVK